MTPPPMIFPPATLEAASRRISLIYQNIIFKEDEEEDEQESGDLGGSRYGKSFLVSLAFQLINVKTKAP